MAEALIQDRLLRRRAQTAQNNSLKPLGRRTSNSLEINRNVSNNSLEPLRMSQRNSQDLHRTAQTFGELFDNPDKCQTDVSCMLPARCIERSHTSADE